MFCGSQQLQSVELCDYLPSSATCQHELQDASSGDSQEVTVALRRGRRVLEACWVISGRKLNLIKVLDYYYAEPSWLGLYWAYAGFNLSRKRKKECAIRPLKKSQNAFCCAYVVAILGLS